MNAMGLELKFEGILCICRPDKTQTLSVFNKQSSYKIMTPLLTCRIILIIVFQLHIVLLIFSSKC